MKNNIELVAWCEHILSINGKYLYGGYFDRVSTQKYINEKAAQYPKQYTPEYKKLTEQNTIGFISGDCCGLIKSYLWLQGETVIYPIDNATKVIQDKSANDMYYAATVKGPIQTMPETIGLLVRYDNHVGVYVGGGWVIEGRGVRYGVVKTRLADRPWLNWYQYNLINYESEVMSMLERTTPTTKGPAVRLYQELLNDLGYDLGKYGMDQSYGDDMVIATNKANKFYGLPETKTGKVTALLYGKLNESIVKKLTESYSVCRLQYAASENNNTQLKLINAAQTDTIKMLTKTSNDCIALKNALTTIKNII